MSILTEILSIAGELGLPVETGAFGDIAPDVYLVLTPMTDSFELFADNAPLMELEEVRISLFSKPNYIGTKNQIIGLLNREGFTITDMRYIGREDETKYHHYVIDVMKEYETEG